MSEGSVYQRKDGRWVAKWKDANDKWCYLYRKTKVEAKKAMRQALKDRDDHIVPVGKMTLNGLLDSWLEDTEDSVSRRTWENRECIVRLHIRPAIGAHRLSKLTHKDFQRLYRAKLAEGLAPSTVKRIHVILKQAFGEAVRHKYINHNPLTEVKPPIENRVEKEILSPEQVKQLLETARGDRMEGVVVLGATCALRVGESLAIRFEDIDFHKGTIKIRRTLWKGNTYQTKTAGSTRTLKLPQIALNTLKRHRDRQNGSTQGWVFPTKNDTPVSATNFHLMWKKLLRRAGLPESLTYHSLRHGVASTLLNQGVPLPVVSRYLRHANPGITASVYSHIVNGSEDAAAGGIDEAIG